LKSVAIREEGGRAPPKEYWGKKKPCQTRKLRKRCGSRTGAVFNGRQWLGDIKHHGKAWALRSGGQISRRPQLTYTKPRGKNKKIPNWVT